MNNIYIKINNFYTTELLFDNLGMNLTHDVFNHKYGNESGIFTIKAKINIDKKNPLKSVCLIINHKVFDISNFEEILFYDADIISLYYENIFDFHLKLLSFINNSLITDYKESLICYSTQLACNLKCHYCSTNCYSYKEIVKPSYDLVKNKISILTNNLKKSDYNYCNNVRYRIMGGETFMVPDIFNYSKDKMLEYHKDINNNTLYLYSNCMVNIQFIKGKLLELSEKMKVIFIASIDSFDANKSARWETDEQIKLFKKNLLELKKIKNDNLIISASIFSNNDITDLLNTLEWLYTNNILDIKITFDEKKLDEISLLNKKQTIDNLINSKFYNKFFSTKNMSSDFLVINFILLENNLFLNSFRSVNKTGNNNHLLYKYNDKIKDFYINKNDDLLK